PLPPSVSTYFLSLVDGIDGHRRDGEFTVSGELLTVLQGDRTQPRRTAVPQPHMGHGGAAGHIEGHRGGSGDRPAGSVTPRRRLAGIGPAGQLIATSGTALLGMQWDGHDL